MKNNTFVERKLAYEVAQDLEKDLERIIDENALDLDRIDINGEFAGFRIYYNYSMARVTVDTEAGYILCRAPGFDDDEYQMTSDLIGKINNYLYMGD